MDTDCPAGYCDHIPGTICVDGGCVPPCANDGSCPPPRTCEDGSYCHDPCDVVVCAGGRTCIEGSCHQICDPGCPPGQSCVLNPGGFHYCAVPDCEEGPGLCIPPLCSCPPGQTCNIYTMTCSLCDRVDRVWASWLDCWTSSCRIASAVALSRYLFSNGAPTAVHALGSEGAFNAGFDAIAGGPLARKLGGPLLLTGSNTLTDATEAELRRLLGAPTRLQRVVILGGTGVISDQVRNAVLALGVATVDRVAGANRYETAAAAAPLVGASRRIAFLANGTVLDGHLAGGIAAALEAPILLTGDDQLHPSTLAALNSLNITETIVIGAVAAIPDAVVAQIPGATRRMDGASQYEVSAALAEYGIARNVDPSHVFVTEGMSLFDALAASASGRILLLSQSACLEKSPCGNNNAPLLRPTNSFASTPPGSPSSAPAMP
ncbi:MAG: cell wall-binding repeat-containing protein [Bradymonadaceae bacterium]